MGAVGPEHFVELLNGRYSVYNKRDARRVQASSLNQFWANAGVTPAGPFAFDPRIIFDRFSSRWFAVSADNSFNDNNFLLAVSNGSIPLRVGGFAITAILQTCVGRTIRPWESIVTASIYLPTCVR